MVTDALVVSAKTSADAQALIVVFGTPTAYLLARRRFPAARWGVYSSFAGVWLWKHPQKGQGAADRHIVGVCHISVGHGWANTGNYPD